MNHTRTAPLEFFVHANSNPPTPDSFIQASDFRLIAIAPTFNNAQTLAAVLAGIEAVGLATIVVDDGSTDTTAAVLRNWLADNPAERFVITHHRNHGKAAAMHTGFARARKMGFSHALTIDTDGQHDPADATLLRAAMLEAPAAIILGHRGCGDDAPLRSRYGRLASNLLVQFISGARVKDSQCGLRIYPLHVIAALPTRSGRYAFETEVLVRAAWANVPIVEVPIRCIYALPTGRVTHFRLLRDSLSAAAMHTRLLTRSITPWPIVRFQAGDRFPTGTLFDRGRRWLNPMRAWRQLRDDPGERERIGASIGWGLFIGTQPPLGYKGALCLLVAKVFRLQPLVVIGTSSLSTPPIGFLLWSAAIIVGHVLLHASFPAAAEYDIATRGPLVVLRSVALEWVIGGLVFGTALGVAAWAITLGLLRCFKPRAHSAAAAT